MKKKLSAMLLTGCLALTACTGSYDTTGQESQSAVAGREMSAVAENSAVSSPNCFQVETLDAEQDQLVCFFAGRDYRLLH